MSGTSLDGIDLACVNFRLDKFWNFEFETGDVSTGQIVRELDGSFRNSISRIYCVNKGSGNGLPFRLYFSSIIPGEVSVNKIIKPKCDPNKISYSTYMHYINKQYYWAGGISSLLIVIFLFLKINRSQELAKHNKNHKNKFNTYAELREYKQKIEDKESLRKTEEFGAEILKYCVKVGGALTGEHGVGIEKRELMCEAFNDTDIQQQLKIKFSLDPNSLLNPGKVYPILRKCAEEGRVHVHHGKTKFPDIPRF